MDKTQVCICRNERVQEDDFTMKYRCDFCSRYTNQLAELRVVSGWNPCICKTCLSETIAMLDKNMQENFQSDFEKARKEEDKTQVAWDSIVTTWKEDIAEYLNVPIDIISVQVETKKGK